MNRRELLKAAAALPLAPAVLSHSAFAQGADVSSQPIGKVGAGHANGILPMNWHERH